jgi:hypothetical protein
MSRLVLAALLLVVAIPVTARAQSDLQGTWTNGTLTPFERPSALGAKAFYTPEEAAAEAQQATERRNSGRNTRRPGDVGNDNEAFVDTGYTMVSTRQTSLVVDPPDGRIPLRAAAEKQRDFNLTSLDTFETMSPWDRCITRSPTNLFPAAYNNGYQIVQTGDYVMIMSEMIHEARIIPLDGRPHLRTGLGQWLGDSRGRWEGKTLVVDTTNFHDRGWIATHAGTGRLRGVPHSKALHLIERLTRVDATTLIYEATIDDPETFERAWTFSIPFVKSDDYTIYEYACHEGNEATGLMLRGARTLEREAATGSGGRPF